MKRNEWEFTFTVGDILDGIEAKLEEAANGLAYWEQQLTQLSETTPDAVTLEHAQQRVRVHKQELKSLARWQCVLHTQPISDELPLHYEDVVFFGLHIQD